MAQKSFASETHQAQQQLNSFDFAQIDQMDPSLAEGLRCIYDKDIYYTIRFYRDENETQDLENHEPLRTRIFILGDEKNPQFLKIEVSSDNDIFFHFVHKADQNNYKQIKAEQNLNLEFNEYPAICIKCFNKVEKATNHNQYNAIFTIMDNGSGRLEINQETEYKNIEVMSFEFECSDDNFIRQVITYKYMSLKSKLSLMEGRLQDIHEIVRVKNPSLLLSIKKETKDKQDKSKQSTIMKKN
ncbi:hypothetical protein ABPG72_009922 [Tetrahymena utriculariae]